jgi:hypothetical protein
LFVCAFAFIVASNAGISNAVAGTPISGCLSDWRSTQGLPGTDGPVNAMTVWDPDGIGPQTELLVVGGEFSIIDDVRVRGIAAWDGSSWHPLGTPPLDGVNGFVRALAVYEGALFAGGTFSTAGGASASFIARWNGTTWAPLGAGTAEGVDNTVWTMCVHNGELIVGGDFTTAGGVAANRVAKWDAATWQPLGVSPNDGMDDRVDAMTVYNGELYAGGWFSTAGEVSAKGVARWTGSTWQPVGAGMQGAVYTLSVFNNELIAGGHFWEAGGASIPKIARWNGTAWQSLGGGVSGGVEFVDALTVHNGELVAGGGFTHAEGINVNYIARWNGAPVGGWQSMGAGLQERVGALTVYDGQLMVGGRFTAADGKAVKRLASWDVSSGWQALSGGMDQMVRAMTVFAGETIAAGDFTRAGDVAASHIAHWDGLIWEPVGNGLTDPSPQGARVCALTHFNGQLIAGGFFTLAGGPGGGVAGGLTVNHIARWLGSTSGGWQPLGAGVNGLGSNTVINALTVFNNELIAAGRFTTAANSGGNITASNIARWNGTLWQTLADPNGEGVNGEVFALTTYNGELIAAGAFTSAGGNPANHIARWRASPGWQALGDSPDEGVSGNVHALTIYQDKLIAAGAFTTAGDESANNIASWNGAAVDGWQALGTGVTGNLPAAIPVNALTVYNGELIAGGAFTNAGGVPANRIARWNGASSVWASMGAGIAGADPATLPSAVRAMVVDGNELMVGGHFTLAGDRVSGYWARWGSLCPTGDVTGDGIVDVDDLLAVITQWGACPAPPAPCSADIAPIGEPDGVVNVDDLLLVILNWGS